MSALALKSNLQLPDGSEKSNPRPHSNTMSTTALFTHLGPSFDAEKATPDDVLQFRHPVDGFLCPVEANVFDIQFLSFDVAGTIKDDDPTQIVYSASEAA